VDVDSVELELGSEGVSKTSESVFAWRVRGVSDNGHVPQCRRDKTDLSLFASLDHFLAHNLVSRPEEYDRIQAEGETHPSCPGLYPIRHLQPIWVVGKIS
jgi:hypothetical protein